MPSECQGQEDALKLKKNTRKIGKITAGQTKHGSKTLKINGVFVHSSQEFLVGRGNAQLVLAPVNMGSGYRMKLGSEFIVSSSWGLSKWFLKPSTSAISYHWSLCYICYQLSLLSVLSGISYLCSLFYPILVTIGLSVLSGTSHHCSLCFICYQLPLLSLFYEKLNSSSFGERIFYHLFICQKEVAGVFEIHRQ